MKRLILILVFACSSFAAHGQQPPNSGSPCPPGMIPGYGTCYSPSDPDRDGQSTQNVRRIGPRWQDRFGAIAVDSKTGSAGWMSNARSKQDAYKGAIDDCGGGGCEVRIQVRNGCVAAAWGGGISSYAAKASLQEAEAVAMGKCKNNGTGAVCKLQYSACSLPVRVQ